MATFHAVEMNLELAVVKVKVYGWEGIGVRCEAAAGLIGALITHLTRHGVSDWR